MGGNSISSSFLILWTLILISTLLASPSAHGSTDREVLESPTPWPPRNRPVMPSDFENILLYRAYWVIQRFKKTITCDPKNKTATWTGPNICDNHGHGYAGFYCEKPPGRNIRAVASVDFNGFHLCAPRVAGFVDALPDLALYHANSNNIKDTVPDLTRLPYFYEIDVSNQKLTGSFPRNVLPLVKLAFLDLRFNTFFGRLPPEVFNIKTQVLFLNNNGFFEGIPANLGQTTAKYITFANNFFSGEIPKSIGTLGNTLIEVLFLNNKLSGCLLSEIGLLKSATVFDAGNNKLTGPIPASFGCLHKVEQLNLAHNQLYGEVPDVLCKLGFQGNLLNLSLSGNYFTSMGPSCYQLLAFKKLDVRRNCILGMPDQRPPNVCAQFARIPKTCPFSTNMPCQPPLLKPKGKNLVELSASPGDGRKDEAPATSGYTTYSALAKHRRP